MKALVRSHRVAASVLAALIFYVGTPPAALAATSADVARDFEWVDLYACKKPRKAAPRLPRESYERYNTQRRYVDIDQDGTCEVMDFWMARLGGNPSPGMRVVEQAAFRYRNGKWTSFVTHLQFYPYAIRSLKTKETIYLDAPSGSDVGDNMPFGLEEVKMSSPSGWHVEKGYNDQYQLVPYEGLPGPAIQALAVLLTERLSGSTVGLPEDVRVLAYDMASYRQDQKKKIGWILKRSAETLTAEDRVPVDAEGLPVIAPE